MTQQHNKTWIRINRNRTRTWKGTGTGLGHESALSVFRMFINSQRAELTMQGPQTKTKCTAHVREEESFSAESGHRGQETQVKSSSFDWPGLRNLQKRTSETSYCACSSCHLRVQRVNTGQVVFTTGLDAGNTGRTHWTQLAHYCNL